MKLNCERLTHPALRYAAASLSPVVWLCLGAVLGGGWTFLALLWITVCLFAADRLARRIGVLQPATAGDIWTRRLAVALGALHFPLLAFAVFALSGGTGLGLFPWIFTFLGFGLWFGQVSNSVAHELIHRSDRRMSSLGMWMFISLLFGHHTSAHRLVHHRFVATPDDPNTAAEGESFYRFALRAWPGAFLAGYEMESALRQGTGGRARHLHPYGLYLGGAAVCAIILSAAFGPLGLLVYLALCAHAQTQLLLSDYVQHYGLARRKRGMDAYEPFGPQHSWDAPDLVSGLMMLHAPRHADHHAHPARPYSELELSPGGKAPLLPYSLPVMATLALVPRLWHRLMDPRLRALTAGRG